MNERRRFAVYASAVILTALVTGCGSSNSPSPSPSASPSNAASIAAHIAVLGDSFASGEGTYNNGSIGNPPSVDYYQDTRVDPRTKGSGCHRSSAAYAPLLGVALKNFVACSGASIASVEKGSKGFPPQLNVLHAGIGVVILSVTGNDFDFGSVLGDCIDFPRHAKDLKTCRDTIKSSIDKISVTMKALSDLYAGIVTATAGARIIQVGYPLLFPAGGHDGCNGIDVVRQNMLNNAGNMLDDAIRNTASKNSHVTFVDVRPLFVGHEICGSSNGPYINDLQTNIFEINCPKSYIVNDVCSQSFHPNTTGYDAEADCLRPVVDALVSDATPSSSAKCPLTAGVAPTAPATPAPSPSTGPACTTASLVASMGGPFGKNGAVPVGHPTCADGYALEGFTAGVGGQQAPFFFKRTATSWWTIDGGNATPIVACRVIPTSVMTKLGYTCSLYSLNGGPEAVVGAIYEAMIAGDWSTACSLVAPDLQAKCNSLNDGKPPPDAGSHFAVIRDVTQGNEALVEVRGSICSSAGCGQVLAMPTGAADFKRVFDSVTASKAYVLSPAPCVNIGGKWYVNTA